MGLRSRKYAKIQKLRTEKERGKSDATEIPVKNPAKKKNLTLVIILAALFGIGGYAYKTTASKGGNFVSATKVSATKVSATKVSEDANNTEENDKKIYASFVMPKKIGIDVFREKPAFIFDGLLVKDGEKIEEKYGFRLTNLRIDTTSSSLEEVVLLAEVSKEGKIIDKLSCRLGDFVKIEYYEGGIQIISKTDSQHSEVALPKEKLCSVFRIDSTKINEKEVIFNILFFNKTKKSYNVDIEKIL